MKLVKEHINFERGLDPKKAMETGLYSTRAFDNSDDAVEFLMNNLPAILGKKNIPVNIINTEDRTWFRIEYYSILHDYIEKHIKLPDRMQVDYIIGKLHDYLKAVGFKKTSSRMYENINFQIKSLLD